MSKIIYIEYPSAIKQHQICKIFFNFIFILISTLSFGCNKNHENNHSLQHMYYEMPVQISREPDFLNILPRSEWTLERPILNKIVPMSRIYRVTIHHTATEDGELFGSTSTILQKIHEIHTGNNGWADIGYHYIIDSAGKIWEGRSIRYQGAHAGSGLLNQGNIGIALIGNFEINKPSELQKNSLIRLVRQLKNKYSIESKNVFGHSHLKGTKCPGEHLHSVVESLRMEK